MASNNGWVWSAQYNDYYRIEYSLNGPQYKWYKQTQPQQPQYSQPYSYHQSGGYNTDQSGTYPNGYNISPRSMRHDSLWEPQPESNSMPPPLDPHMRARFPDLIPGTPGKGFCEQLDPSYMMRRDAREFFKKGRVFSMMHVEAASEDAVREMSPYKDSITVVRFGAHAFSQIRRFVVVAERQGFCYACPISTYSNRGTLKRGCNPAEHAVVYIKGTTPVRFRGEDGMTVEPIAVEPVEPDMILEPASRVRLGKVYPIEWNVKVKDIGKVAQEDMSKLVTWSRVKNPELLGNEGEGQ